MMNIDLRLDWSSLAEDLAHSPERADAAVLTETYFVFPVRLHVNGVDLFELQNQKGPDRGWFPLPVIGFASSTVRELENAKQTGKAAVSLASAGNLALKIVENDQLHLSCNINDNSSVATVAEAEIEFAKFCGRVRDILVKHCPQLQNHSWWRIWFPSPT